MQTQSFKQLVIFASLVLGLGTLSACNYRIDKTSGQAGPGASLKATPGFDDVFGSVIGPKCATCHGASTPAAGISLTTYAEVITNLDASMAAIESNRMPKGRPLSRAEKEILRAWVQAGAPEQGSQPTDGQPGTDADDGTNGPGDGGEQPAPVPVPEPDPGTNPNPEPGPVAIDFARVQAEVLQPRCVDCHGGSGGVFLDSYASAKDSLGLVQSAIAAGTMPPGRPLTAEQKSLVLTWIEQGAPEFAQSIEPDATPQPTPAPTPAATPQPTPSPTPRATPSPRPSPTATPAPTPAPTPIPATELDFARVRAEVFEPRCLSCHGSGGGAGGVSMASFEDVTANLGLIQSAIATGTMPLGRPLTPEQKALVLDWIAKGAPESVATTPPPVNPEPVLEPTFASIRSLIFAPKCLSCHGEGGRVAHLSLESVQKIVELELIDLEDPDKSELLDVVTRDDFRQMPPPRTGLGPLTSKEISVLRKWIELGAPERNSSARVKPDCKLTLVRDDRSKELDRDNPRDCNRRRTKNELDA